MDHDKYFVMNPTGDSIVDRNVFVRAFVNNRHQKSDIEVLCDRMTSQD